MMNIQTELAAFPIVQTFPVQWGEMDAFRHVNNLVYLRWSESGRIAYFEQLPLNVSTPELAEFSVVLGWQACKYIFAVTYPDTVHVGTKVTAIKADRFVMECRIFSEQHQRLATISTHEVVTVNYQQNKKVSVPPALIAAIEQIENQQLSGK